MGVTATILLYHVIVDIDNIQFISDHGIIMLLLK